PKRGGPARLIREAGPGHGQLTSRGLLFARRSINTAEKRKCVANAKSAEGTPPRPGVSRSLPSIDIGDGIVLVNVIRMAVVGADCRGFLRRVQQRPPRIRRPREARMDSALRFLPTAARLRGSSARPEGGSTNSCSTILFPSSRRPICLPLLSQHRSV